MTTRVFNGTRYKLEGAYATKAQAMKRAKDYHKVGFLARAVKAEKWETETKAYRVYVKPKEFK